jgi:hypothetical protein
VDSDFAFFDDPLYAESFSSCKRAKYTRPSSNEWSATNLYLCAKLCRRFLEWVDCRFRGPALLKHFIASVFPYAGQEKLSLGVAGHAMYTDFLLLLFDYFFIYI